jgi:hypothetical protein
MIAFFLFMNNFHFLSYASHAVQNLRPDVMVIAIKDKENYDVNNRTNNIL